MSSGTAPRVRSLGVLCGPSDGRQYEGKWRGEAMLGRMKRLTYGPVFLCWRSQGAEDGLQLVHVGLAREIGSSQHQLCEDAANRPDVDCCAVVSTAPKQFCWTVPS